MKKSKSFRGSILPTILIVSVFMLVMVLAALTYMSLDMRLYSGWHKERQTRLALKSALAICCCDSSVFAYGDSTSIAITGDIHVNVSRRKWGFYEILTASSGPYRVKHLVGKKHESGSHAAFWLCDRNRALSLAGKTTIDGLVYMPLNGINYIEYGDYMFTGRKVQNMNMRISKMDLPEVITNADDLSKSYTTLHVGQADDLVVSSKSSVNDIISNARKVTVNPGFNGNLQIMCSDTVIVSHNVDLKYPSGIYVRSMSGFPYVELQHDSRVEGYVIVEGAAADLGLSHPCYRQDGSSSLVGMLYSDGSCNLAGNFSGAIYVKDCYHVLNENKYPGVLYDVHIKRNDSIAYPIALDGLYRRKIIKKIHEHE